jgi:hypothetical protein
VSAKLGKPLETNDRGAVLCPERGGKNTQCCKSSALYEFAGGRAGAKHFLYVQTIAPTLNDISLWVGPAQEDAEFAKCRSEQAAGPLVPHKHASSKKWLCCPAYVRPAPPAAR